MKKHIAFLCIGLLVNTIDAMQLPKPPEQIFFINRTTNERFSFPKALFPEHSFIGFGNEIYTNLTTPFMHLLSNLLYVNHNLVCTERAISTKCFKDIKKFFQNSPLVQSYDFASWFELAYFVDLCNLPSIIKDELLCHLTKLIRGHELEAAQATADIADEVTQRINTATWKTIATFYYLLFDQELEIEGITKKDYEYSIQQLVILDKIKRSAYTKDVGDFHSVTHVFNLNNAHVNSLEGWELLFTLHKREPRPQFAVISFELHLSNNNISFIPKGFLQDIHIATLNLANNNLVILPDDFFSFMSTIETLDLSHNKLKELPNNFLLLSHWLVNLELNNNKLITLPNPFLPQCFNLIHIDLGHNKLKELPDNFLSASVILKNISLDNNKLITLPNNFLNNAKKLKTLDLKYNKLTTLPNPFLPNSPQLVSLDLADNELAILPDNFLPNSPLLDILDLNNNQLQRLPNNFLSNAQNLTGLFLGHNALIALPPLFLSHATQLETLKLDGNQLSFLPNSFLIGCTKLQYLFLQNKDSSHPQLRGDIPDHVTTALYNAGELQQTQMGGEKREREEETLEQPEAKRQKK
jgi:Leucine-rich repeat (LRR) protein